MTTSGSILENSHWLASLGFGALIVGVCYWSRFDEPSYDGTSEYFARYSPRFSTSRRRYVRARLGYVCAILILFVIFSAIPEVFYALLPDDVAAKAPKPGDATLPLGIALIMVAFQTIPRLNEGERRIRGILHSIARIPESIRRTVAQLRGSPFNCNPAALASQTRKLNMQLGKAYRQPKDLTNLILEDDLLHLWYSVGCVLSALSESNQANTGIDSLFYDTYKNELDSISDRHMALAPHVRRYLIEVLRIGNPADIDPDANLFREVRSLRDRLYTFVACGVRSSVTNDAEGLEIIGRLGFAIRPEPSDHQYLQAVAWLSAVALLVLSVFAVWLTQLFIAYGLNNDPEKIATFRLPTNLFGQFYWSWTTAAFYFFSIFGALLVRRAYLGRREWFDLNNFDRERPIPRYAKPVLLGGSLGYLALVVIALLGGPIFNLKAVGDVGDVLLKIVLETLPWAPLAIVIAAIALWLSDSAIPDQRVSYRNMFGQAVIGGLVMAMVGDVTSHIAFRDAKDFGMTNLYLDGFIGTQIGLITVVLFVIVQLSTLYADSARSFVGKRIEALTRQGRQFCIALERDGSATLMKPNGTTPDIACRGHWQQFPEGTAVKWDTQDESCKKAGSYGLMSSFGDSLIYEGYAERFAGIPDSVLQLNIRASKQDAAASSGTAQRASTAAMPPQVGNLVPTVD